VRPLDAEGRRSWTDLNVASLNAFKAIELVSGVKFFHKSGSLACGRGAYTRPLTTSTSVVSIKAYTRPLLVSP
jgi:hypothetical protein